MNNPVYKLMISNAREQLDSQNPNSPKTDDFTIWDISRTLAMLLCKTKEDVMVDLINSSKVIEEKKS